MADTVREQIMQALVAALAGVGATIYRERRSPVKDDICPAVVVTDEGQGPADYTLSAGVVRYDMAVALEGYVKAAGDAAAGQARNALYGQVLLALNDPALRALVIDIDEGALSPQTDSMPGAAAVSGWRLDLTLAYETTGDPYIRA